MAAPPGRPPARPGAEPAEPDDHPGGDDDGGAAALAPGTKLGRFEILQPLGAGGMGVVYEARDPDLERTVAVKVLRRSRHVDALRLWREAQALAQLQHPNVVAIYDVGVAGDGLFLAMERVDGHSLGEHFETARPTWRQALDAYLQAGRGLAAAHGKSIVHRDFKPANVLIDRHGRVRVTDFGLARLAEPGEAAADDRAGEAAADDRAGEPVPFAADATLTVTDADASSAADLDLTSDRAPFLASPLTQTGVLLGTPRYMAPEQRARLPATARSDQYAFCVCVWEAVFGEHPFPAGARPGAPPRPTSRRAPRWLVRALSRGLAFDSNQRHPSMAELLDELERAPRRRRRLFASAGAVAIAGAGALGVLALRPPPADACRDLPILAEWDARRREAIRTAFADTGARFAADSFHTVAARLDDYARRWQAMRRDNCRATRVIQEQSEALMDARNQCLDRRRDEVAALLEVLGRADRDTVERAVEATGALRDLDACADVGALSRRTPLPQDPARAEAIRALERDLAVLSAQLDTGRLPDDDDDAIAALVARARALDHPPVHAAALDLAGRLAAARDRWEQADDLAREALLEAEVAADDELRFHLLTTLVEIGGYRLQRFEASDQHARAAEALLRRLGASAARVARLHYARALTEWWRGDYPRALDYITRSIDAREREHPRDDVWLGRTLHIRAIIEEGLDRNDDALASEERAIALTEAALGDRHPYLAKMLLTAGIIHREARRYDEAERRFRRALELLEEATGESSDFAAALLNLGNLHRNQHRLEDALVTYRRAVEVLERTVGPSHNRVADVLDMLGLTLTQLGAGAEGEAAAQRSLAIREANGAGQHPSQVTAIRLLGQQYRLRGRWAESLAMYERALGILEARHGADSPKATTSLVGMARAHLGLKQPARARALLERALRLTEAPEASGQRSLVQFHLARSMWATPADRARALELAHAVRQLWAAEGDADGVAEVDQWLTEVGAR